jgi:hypothetical protein
MGGMHAEVSSEMGRFEVVMFLHRGRDVAILVHVLSARDCFARKGEAGSRVKEAKAGTNCTAPERCSAIALWRAPRKFF